jgi:hypothetical protein
VGVALIAILDAMRVMKVARAGRKKLEGDLKSMMKNKRGKGKKDDTMKNANHHRDQLPPLP